MSSETDTCEVQYIDQERVDRARMAIPRDEASALLSETFRLLGDATRLKIAFALSNEELCVCDLANLLGMSQSAVSHSLRALRQMNLVRLRREGKIAYYTLADEHILQVLELGFAHVEELL